MGWEYRILEVISLYSIVSDVIVQHTSIAYSFCCWYCVVAIDNCQVLFYCVYMCSSEQLMASPKL